MRWFWIDRFLEFESHHRAVAVKTISMSEDYLPQHYHGYPVMPHSLVIEGLAQTGGLLVGECNQFEERVVLAKVAKAVFHTHAVPGDTLTYETIVEKIDDDGAIITGTSRIGDRLHAEVELFFAHLDDDDSDRQLFEPGDFISMLRVYGLYDVGRNKEGGPLEVPPALLAAESANNGRTSG